jgi:mannonate dehydratase
MALWDIKGKRAKMPVYQLLGGTCREFAAMYSHAHGASFAEVEEAARALIAQGYRHVRCQMAVPGHSTYGAHSADDPGRRRPPPWEPGPYCRLVPRLFDHLRSRLGDEIELLHDIHERVPPIDAIGLAKALDLYRLFFLEDPFAPEDNGYFPLLRQQSATPIAMGELFVNQAEYVPLIKDRLIDFIRCHVSAIGGLTPARKLAAFAEFFGVRTAWHGPGDVSPVGHAANLALDLACPNFGIQEGAAFGERTHESSQVPPRSATARCGRTTAPASASRLTSERPPSIPSRTIRSSAAGRRCGGWTGRWCGRNRAASNSSLLRLESAPGCLSSGNRQPRLAQLHSMTTQVWSQRRDRRSSSRIM